MSLPERPKLKVPITRLEIALELLGLPPLVMMVLAIIQYWSQLPDVIPVHFGMDGTANGWSGKGTLFWLSGFSILSYIGISVIASFPETFNYVWPITEQNAESQYLLARKFLRALKLELAVLMFFAAWSIICVAVKAAPKADISSILALTVMMILTSLVYLFGAFRMR